MNTERQGKVEHHLFLSLQGASKWNLPALIDRRKKGAAHCGEISFKKNKKEMAEKYKIRLSNKSVSCFFNANIGLQSFLSFLLNSLFGSSRVICYVGIDPGEWLCFGCTPPPICLEYPGGWRATGAQVVVLDVWQRGHYSCSHLRGRASSRLALWELVSTRVRLSGRRTSSGEKIIIKKKK